MIEHVPACQGCGKFPEELPCYADEVRHSTGREPTDEEVRDYVRREEGTFNAANGHFLCDGCYIRAGMPSSPTGWTCP